MQPTCLYYIQYIVPLPAVYFSTTALPYHRLRPWWCLDPTHPGGEHFGNSVCSTYDISSIIGYNDLSYWLFLGKSAPFRSLMLIPVGQPCVWHGRPTQGLSFGSGLPCTSVCFPWLLVDLCFFLLPLPRLCLGQATMSHRLRYQLSTFLNPCLPLCSNVHAPSFRPDKPI